MMEARATMATRMIILNSVWAKASVCCCSRYVNYFTSFPAPTLTNHDSQTAKCELHPTNIATFCLPPHSSIMLHTRLYRPVASPESCLAALASSLNALSLCPAHARPQTQASITLIRHASHATQGRANGPKDSAGRRLGAKKTASEFVIPGNIIFKQRGTSSKPSSLRCLRLTLLQVQNGSPARTWAWAKTILSIPLSLATYDTIEIP
jgi:hypothetical protein